MRKKFVHDLAGSRKIVGDGEKIQMVRFIHETDYQAS